MHDGTGAMFMVAAGPGELSAREYFPLNGKSADIRAANDAAGLVVTRDNAVDYVRFFTTFLRMKDGEPFVIVESLNGYRLVNDDKPDQRIPAHLSAVNGLDFDLVDGTLAALFFLSGGTLSKSMNRNERKKQQQENWQGNRIQSFHNLALISSRLRFLRAIYDRKAGRNCVRPSSLKPTSPLESELQTELDGSRPA